MRYDGRTFEGVDNGSTGRHDWRKKEEEKVETKGGLKRVYAAPGQGTISNKSVGTMTTHDNDDAPFLALR